MLKILRQKGISKKILWVVAIVVILSFGFFGTAYLVDNTNSPATAGKALGQNVSIEEFRHNLTQVTLQAKLRYGDNFSKIRNLLNLEEEAWDRIILLKEARRQKITVADADVVRTVHDFGFFKKGGAFSPEYYERIIRASFNCTPRQFEEGIRESLMLSKLFDSITDEIAITDSEIFEEYKKKNEAVQVSYLLFSPQDYQENAAFTAEEMTAYYQKHADTFTVAESINLSYLQIPLNPKATPEAKESTISTANLIYDFLQKNPDLAAAAQKYGLEIKETGPFSMEKPPEIGWSYAILQRAFELKENEISEPLEDAQSYLFIKLKERRLAHVPSFEEARKDVLAALKQEKAREIARVRAEEFLKSFQTHLAGTPKTSFPEYVEAQGRTLTKIPAFHRHQYIESIGIAKEFQETAFTLTAQTNVSPVVSMPQGFGIIYLESFQPVSEENFQKEKETFSQELIAQKKNRKLQDYLASLRQKAQVVSFIASEKPVDTRF